MTEAENENPAPEEQPEQVDGAEQQDDENKALVDQPAAAQAETVPPGDDFVSKMIEQMKEKMKLSEGNNYWIVVGSAGAFWLLYGIFTIFLAAYGYGGSDPKNCFYVDGVDSVGLTREQAIGTATAAGVQVKAGYPVNMAHLFRGWFLWGFWTSLYTIAIVGAVIPLHIYMPSKRGLVHMVGLILSGISVLNSIIWYLAGFFWRFSRAGRVAAGAQLERPSGVDSAAWSTQLKQLQETNGYQLAGGKFMSVYIWIILVIVLLGVAGGSVAAVMMCRKSDAADKLPQDEQQNQEANNDAEGHQDAAAEGQGEGEGEGEQQQEEQPAAE